MPPVRVGLETGGKAEDREHGAGDGSDDRDIEAWVGKRGGNLEGKETTNMEKSVQEMRRFSFGLKGPFSVIIIFK